MQPTSRLGFRNLTTTLCLVLCLITFDSTSSSAQGFRWPEEPKNLKVFPKDTSKKDIKKAMKKIAKALDVQCDFCHDLDDMAKDTEKKETARGMMKMANAINKKSFKSKPRVRCVTCHNGKKKPK